MRAGLSPNDAPPSSRPRIISSRVIEARFSVIRFWTAVHIFMLAYLPAGAEVCGTLETGAGGGGGATFSTLGAGEEGGSGGGGGATFSGLGAADRRLALRSTPPGAGSDAFRRSTGAGAEGAAGRGFTEEVLPWAAMAARSCAATAAAWASAAAFSAASSVASVWRNDRSCCSLRSISNTREARMSSGRCNGYLLIDDLRDGCIFILVRASSAAVSSSKRV